MAPLTQTAVWKILARLRSSVPALAATAAAATPPPWPPRTKSLLSPSCSASAARRPRCPDGAPWPGLRRRDVEEEVCSGAPHARRTAACSGAPPARRWPPWLRAQVLLEMRHLWVKRGASEQGLHPPPSPSTAASSSPTAQPTRCSGPLCPPLPRPATAPSSSTRPTSDERFADEPEDALLQRDEVAGGELIVRGRGLGELGVHGVEHGANADVELCGPATCAAMAGFGKSPPIVRDRKLKFRSAPKNRSPNRSPIKMSFFFLSP